MNLFLIKLGFSLPIYIVADIVAKFQAKLSTE